MAAEGAGSVTVYDEALMAVPAWPKILESQEKNVKMAMEMAMATGELV